jgi:beta-galactosidase
VLPLTGLRPQARTALIFDYASQWMGQIQPQGADHSVIHECFRAYSALRGLGLDVDVLPADAPLAGYALIVLPALLHVHEALAQALAASRAQVVVGARSGSKSAQLSIAEPLPPGPLTALLGLSVLAVESLPPGVVELARLGAVELSMQGWRERLACAPGTVVEAAYTDGRAALTRHGRARYLAGCPDSAGWTSVLEKAAADAGLATERLPEGLRVSRLGTLTLVCNFADTACDWSPAPEAREVLPLGVAIWQLT